MTTRTRTINRRYRLERRISLTGDTETWLGFDNVLHRSVAVSMPRPELLRDGPFVVQFLQRSRIATALHHRGVVAAFDSGEDGDTPYLVTEYLGGESLADIIGAESPFDVDDVAILIDQLAGALDYAHQRGFVHGGLAPDQVVVDTQGVAKLVGLGLPAGSSLSSNPHAPLSIDDDIAALGAIAFEMLTGEEPDAVEADSAGEAYLIDPDVPRQASDVVAIALGAGSARYISAGAFARSLSEWRTFDPGEFFFAPEPVSSWTGGEAVDSAPALRPSFIAESELSSIASDVSPADPDRASRPGHTGWLLVAALVLMVAAGVLVWRSSEDVVGGASALPSGIESLAQLWGF